MLPWSSGIFSMFIEGFSRIAAPLTRSMRKAFMELKDYLTSALVLTLPDESEGFVVFTDASKVGSGVILMQQGKPVVYASRQHKVHELY